MRQLLEGIRFVLEVVALVAAAVVGASVAWPAAIVAPLVLGGVWGRFVAPKSASRLADPLRLALEVCLFGSLGAGLAWVGHPVAGLVFAGASIVVAVVLRLAGSGD